MTPPAPDERPWTVLHVLPHRGGGGTTYVQTLSAMAGYSFEVMALTQAGGPAVPQLLRGALAVPRAARRYDLLHVHGEVAAAACFPSLAARPSVITLHGLNLLRRLNGLARKAAQANLRLILRAASRTICVSQAEYRDVVDAVGAQAARRAVVIPNGVRLAPRSATDRMAARSALGIPHGATVALWAGSMEPHKDPFTPLAAVRKLSQPEQGLVLLMAGDGPLRRQLEDARVAAARLLGQRDDMAQLLAAADFFVLSSEREGLSFALLEAMASGLPAVVSDTPGNREAVADTGIVVPYKSVDGFAAAFASLARDVAVRRSLGERAAKRAASCYGADLMVQRTAALYDSVLNCAADSGHPGRSSKKPAVRQE